MYQFAFFIVRLFRKLIENVGADYNQVQMIVRMKLTLDNRKSISPGDTKKERNSAVWYQIFVYLFFGIMFAVLIGSNDSVSTSMFITFSFLLMLSSINMIAEFSTLLLDTRDNTILIPRPVSERTLLLGRVFHIATYILIICLSFSIAPLIVTAIKFNIMAGVIFFLEVILSALFSIFITHVFYLSLMKYTSGERFKDIIAYFQTVMTIIFMGGYQLLPRYLDKIDIGSTSGWKMLFLPPAWMKGAVEIFASKWSIFNGILLAISFLVPLTGIWIVVKYLAPGYSRKLIELDLGDQTYTKKSETQREKKSIAAFFAKIFTRTSSENSSFQISWKITGRDRTFKQTIFALMGSMLVMVFIIGFRDAGNMETLRNGYRFLYLLYTPFYFFFYLIVSSKYSNNLQTSWIYVASPVTKPGEILTGLYKALILKFYVPVYFICNLVTIYIWGWQIAIHVLTGFFLNIMTALILFSLFKSDLPFSVEKKAANSGSNIALSFLMFIVAFALGGLHFVFVWYHFPVFALLLFTILGCWLMFHVLQKRDWNRFEPVNI